MNFENEPKPSDRENPETQAEQIGALEQQLKARLSPEMFARIKNEGQKWHGTTGPFFDLVPLVEAMQGDIRQAIDSWISSIRFEESDDAARKALQRAIEFVDLADAEKGSEQE